MLLIDWLKLVERFEIIQEFEEMSEEHQSQVNSLKLRGLMGVFIVGR